MKSLNYQYNGNALDFTPNTVEITATCRKNNAAYLPAIIIITGTMRLVRKIRPRNSFWGYIKKEAAINYAQWAIDNNNLLDFY